MNQKLINRGSTDSELVGVNDSMSTHLLGLKYVLETQVYGVSENVVYQDKLSAILLEKYSKALSSK